MVFRANRRKGMFSTKRMISPPVKCLEVDNFILNPSMIRTSFAIRVFFLVVVISWKFIRVFVVIVQEFSRQILQSVYYIGKGILVPSPFEIIPEHAPVIFLQVIIQRSPCEMCASWSRHVWPYVVLYYIFVSLLVHFLRARVSRSSSFLLVPMK